MVHNYFVSIIDKDYTNLIGSKGKNLRILSKIGFDVPPAFCIISKAYERFVDNTNLRKIIHETLQDDQLGFKDKSRKITNLILEASIPEEIRTELEAHDFFKRLNLKWAVRSASNLEDLDNVSFAGLYDSYLNLKDLDDIFTAIKKCWASLWNERAIIYRENNNLNHEKATMAVIIQEMVNSQYAGVIFTKNPDPENQDEIFLEYCEGIGESLVSGQITPYSCRINKSSLTIHHLKMPDRKKFADDDIRKLSKLALKVEDHFGSPQDIEWAFDGETIYLLQTRPISSQIRSEQISMDGIWTRANIGEVLPNVITPLTWAVFRATLMNCPDLALKPSENVQFVDEGLKKIHGRGYIHLKFFLDSFCYLPFVTPKVMSRVLGTNSFPEGQSYSRPSGALVRLAQLVFILSTFGILPRLSWMIKQMPPLPHKDRNRLEEIIVWNARCFQLHLKCTAYSIGAFALLEYLLNRWLPSESESFIPHILIGNENLQTAAQGISLWRLANHAKTYPALRKILETDFNWSVIAQQIANVDGGPQFLSLFQAFLDANGARAAGEFELAVPRWREDPTFVVNVIRKFLEIPVNGSPSFDPTMWHSQRQKAISHIKSFLLPIQRLAFSQILASYADFCTLRENIKYRLMEGYSLLREIFFEIGTQLKANRVVELASDIFFLRPAEIMALSTGDCQPQQTKVLISERKAQHARWEAQDAPDLIFVGGNEELNLQKSDLTGIGCSPGIVEGVARVLRDISEAQTLVPGEILVTPHTDPGWTPLFLSCKAVVTEIGGFLSHGATVAREYGLPAVVNVRGATTRIHTGDLIRVNGTTGQVSLCNQHKGKD